MALYCIAFEQRHPQHDYGHFIIEMARFQSQRVTDRVWTVDTHLNSHQLQALLAPMLGATDPLFIAELAGPATWWNVEGRAWLDGRLREQR